MIKVSRYCTIVAIVCYKLHETVTIEKNVGELLCFFIALILVKDIQIEMLNCVSAQIREVPT